MKLSQAIKELEKILQENGDIPFYRGDLEGELEATEIRTETINETLVTVVL